MLRFQSKLQSIIILTFLIFLLCPSHSNVLAEEPIIHFFSLEKAGTHIGLFTYVSGIGSENEIVEHRIFDEHGNEIIQKIPGRLRFLDVTLGRGITGDLSLWQWRQQVIEGNIDDARGDFTIKALDEMMTPIAQWNFIRGWPSKIEGKVNSSIIEEITIVHEGVVRIQ